MSKIDLDAEMRKEPEDRAPGTDFELLKSALDFGESIGQLNPTDKKTMLTLLEDDDEA